jgi:hypothetical protein
MAEGSVALILLEAADQDLRACAAPAQTPSIGDAVVWFHAQQAVEKALKAVLSARGVAFRRTRDIAELLDLLADSGIEVPPHADWLDSLNPYAVEARYGLVGPSGLDRDGALARLHAVLAWARAQLPAGASGGDL